MSITVNGSVISTCRFTQTSPQAFSINFSGTATREYLKTFSTSDVSKLYFHNYTSITTTQTLVDLTSLTDAFGQSITFATLKHLMVVNNDATNSLTVGGGTNGVFSALPLITAGGCVNLTTNQTIDSTHKYIKLLASAGTISVDLYLVGN